MTTTNDLLDILNNQLINAIQANEELRKDLDACKNKNLLLTQELSEWELGGIKWTINDFLELEVGGYVINEEQAHNALREMIRKNDCNHGITWVDVEYYYQQFATKL